MNNKADIQFEVKKITSAKNPVIAEFAKLKNKKYRDEKGIFIVEGKKLFEEAFKVRENLNIRNIIVSERNMDFLQNHTGFISFIKKYRKENIQGNVVILLDDNVFHKITDEKSPQGIICVIEKSKEKRTVECGLPVIILNDVRDPGNLGTIIRSMNALSKYNLVLAGDCADMYSPKVIRASMGAFFHQSKRITTEKDIKKVIENLKSCGYTIYATHLSSDAKNIEDVCFDVTKTAVVFGNEGNGLTVDILNMCDENVIIPVQPDSESLNVSVAAAIFLWTLKS